MLLSFLDIPVRPLVDRLFRRGFSRFSFLKARFLLDLLLKSRILVFPVTNGPRYCDDALNSSVFNEATCFLHSLQFSLIVRFVVVRELNELAIFQA
tara:strand:+ start:452 stop:739 length:288 start_codon:yes stop_codon:yes gene_type:complete